MKAFLLRHVIIGGAFLAGVSGVVFGAACASLSDTSPLPSPDASDLDAGAPPPEPEEASVTPPAPASDAAPPASGRVRVANLIRGSGAVDLCVKVDPSGPWEAGWITGQPASFSGVAKGDGLNFGEISQHVFLPAAEGPNGTRYQFRIVPLGGACDGKNPDGSAAIILASVGATILRQGAGLTIYGYGVIADGVDAGDGNPRGSVISDTISPPGNVSLFRVVHGVPDIAAFDVVINGETVLNSIRYGTAYGFPYATVSATAPPPPGFANIAAGVPEEATLTLRSGTTVRSFTVPARLRRGIASTVFVGGSANQLTVQLCSDRTPASGDLATCTKLVPQE